MAIEPKTKLDQEKMGDRAAAPGRRRSDLPVYTDEDTGQTIIAGMGELHLEIIRDRMLREFKVEANAGKPQIAYRETITTPADGEGKFIKQSGGRGQYGHVVVKVQPNERGKGITIENKVVGGTIPKEYIPACKKGIEEAMLNGVVGGYPVIDAERRHHRRLLPRRRLERNGVQDGGDFRGQGCLQEGRSRFCSSRS